MTVTNYKLLACVWIILAVIVFLTLFKITAPYGRHLIRKSHLSINNKLGWIIMEIVSPLSFGYFFIQSGEKAPVNWLFFSMWMAHYFNRSIIYPLRMPGKNKQMPLAICISAIFFNSINGFLNGYFLGTLKPGYELSWLEDPRFIFGCILFLTGFLINIHSDNIIFKLARSSSTGQYKIPTGGLFRWVSSPNYLGEIIEWCGWALATWSLPGLTFAIWTFANLFPRAFSHHRWYQSHFENYPKNRKAIIPAIA